MSMGESEVVASGSRSIEPAPVRNVKGQPTRISTLPCSFQALKRTLATSNTSCVMGHSLSVQRCRSAFASKLTSSKLESTGYAPRVMRDSSAAATSAIKSAGIAVIAGKATSATNQIGRMVDGMRSSRGAPIAFSRAFSWSA
jgi:hypothetical protein